MEVTIDTYTYDKLKEYSQRLDEPMSVIAIAVAKALGIDADIFLK